MVYHLPAHYQQSSADFLYTVYRYNILYQYCIYIYMLIYIYIYIAIWVGFLLISMSFAIYIYISLLIIYIYTISYSQAHLDVDYYWLVVWNMFFFYILLGMIIPTDELIFFRGVGQPPTRYPLRFPLDPIKLPLNAIKPPLGQPPARLLLTPWRCLGARRTSGPIHLHLGDGVHRALLTGNRWWAMGLMWLWVIPQNPQVHHSLDWLKGPFYRKTMENPVFDGENDMVFL